MTKPSLLITRSEIDAQVFINPVSEFTSHITAQSFLHFESVTFDTDIQSDWLFFYSQKGVEFYLDQAPAFTGNIGAYGPSTAAKLKNNGIEATFIGTGSAKLTAEKLNAQAKGSSITFIKGSKSLNSLAPLLHTSIHVDHRIVYRQSPMKRQIAQPPDILVFTSPLNFEAYISSNPIQKRQKIFAIGSTTASTIRATIDHPVYVAKNPSMQGLADVVISTIKAR